MTKTISITFVAIAVVALALTVFAGTAFAGKPSACSTIQSGDILDTAGNPVSAGFDQWGYNYQAHMFSGYYDNFSRPAEPVTSGDTLIMKWSNSWLANVDCDGDDKLDRGLVKGSSVPTGTSMGWLTNHLNGSYSDINGEHHYTDFVKIVWVGPGGSLWGQYQIIQEVWNDPAAGFSGLFSKFGAPGFGLNDQWTTLTP